MISFRRNQISENTIESTAHSVKLVSTETALLVSTRWFALGATYRRPASLEVSGESSVSLAVWDHVMHVRIAALALPFAVLAIRRMLR
jgi:uncharacterized PurR-regulated membrane protein YhhQ (DUF165 family)